MVSVIPNAMVAENFRPLSYTSRDNDRLPGAPPVPRPTPRAIGPDDTITIVVISRLFYNKGTDLLIAAIPQILASHPNVRFIIAGSGPKAIDLEDLSFRKKVELAIAFGLLRQEDKQAYLVLNALRNKVAHNLDLQIRAEHSEKLHKSFSKFFLHLYGREQRSYTKYRVVLRQCIRVMWVHLNQGRIEQNKLKEKVEAQNKRIREIADDYRKKNPDFDPLN